MPTLFVLAAMVTGIVLLQLEVAIIAVLSILGNHSPPVVEVIIGLVTYAFFAIVILSQIKTHITMWALMFLASADITAPPIEVGNQSEVLKGSKWMLKEQIKSMWYVINFGKIKNKKS